MLCALRWCVFIQKPVFPKGKFGHAVAFIVFLYAHEFQIIFLFSDSDLHRWIALLAPYLPHFNNHGPECSHIKIRGRPPPVPGS